MSASLRHRSLDSLHGVDPGVVSYLLELARELKRAKTGGAEHPQLRGKNLAVLMASGGRRRPCAFDQAAVDQGAHLSYIDPDAARLDERDGVKDLARVLGRLYDAIEYRGGEAVTIQDLARWAGVPVYSGLQAAQHPSQILADSLTLQEHGAGPHAHLRLAYLGDARMHMTSALLHSAMLMRLDIQVAAPAALWPHPATVDEARQKAFAYGSSLTLTDSPEQAVQGADFICTDPWLSVADGKDEWAERLAQLGPYQVNADLLKCSGNADVKFLHGRTSPQRDGNGPEVTREVFESKASLVREQEDNRLHAIKAMLVASLA